MKIFLAGAVSTATDEQLKKYEVYKLVLEQFGELTYPDKIWEFRQKCIDEFPEKNKIEIDKLMTDYDLNLVRECNLMVCDISQISTGLGIELGVVLENKKKVIFFYEKGSYVSNMITGSFSDSFFIEYDSVENLKTKLKDEVKNLIN